MMCPCGGETRTSTHEVLTLRKAREWSSVVTEKHLPVTIGVDRCPGCGRQHVVVQSGGNRIEVKG